MYVFDNSPLSVLFRNYYRGRFPTLWDRFDGMIIDGRIVSTREVSREAEESSIESLRNWTAQQQGVFPMPTAAEGAFVAGIYAVAHFQQNIEQKKLLKGGRNADPFVIAKAAIEERSVVTMEQFKRMAPKSRTFAVASGSTVCRWSSSWSARAGNFDEWTDDLTGCPT